MGLRDMLKKKDRLAEGYSADPDTVNRLAAPEFTFIRSDTHTEERIFPPAPEEEYQTAKDSSALTAAPAAKPRRSLDVFKTRSRGSSTSSVGNKEDAALTSPPLPQQQQSPLPSPTNQGSSQNNNNQLRPKETMGRRLSQRLHIGTSSSRRSSANTSEFVPENLPTINLPPDAAEPEWEARATILAHQTEQARSRSGSVTPSPLAEKENPYELPPLDMMGGGNGMGGPITAAAGNEPRPNNVRKVSSQQIDSDIQEAIRLHEDGQLEQSTVKFGILADPNGANNPLSQVLYGLALRHGWGCTPDPARAITFLSAAASNAALIEDLALKAGMKKGGAAKGELVLAIFELANCFRHGWGIPKDSVAAKQYYETAANLGDTDAMNEVAWCYVEGFGCKKDKYSAAKYYRLAEQNGNKTLGNTWIWKDKYNPPDANGNGGGKKKK
ncbi:HCP-like protein [Apiospora arundinis]|uniref:HCP-like protein n=1 Tax=Apiospora arundinis TaxID=335852 RepID=A0ABR2JBA4_9PEZI